VVLWSHTARATASPVSHHRGLDFSLSLELGGGTSSVCLRWGHNRALSGLFFLLRASQDEFGENLEKFRKQFQQRTERGGQMALAAKWRATLGGYN